MSIPNLSLRSSTGAALLAVALLVLSTLAASADSGYGGVTRDDTVSVKYISDEGEELTPLEAFQQRGTVRQEEWMQAPLCISARYRNELEPGCTLVNQEREVLCPNGSNAEEPWWMRYRVGSGPWSNWSIRTWYRCPNETSLETEVRNAWRTMEIRPNTITIEPDQGWVIATVPTVVYADRGSRILDTTLVGRRVLIRATPASYLWDWGDGVSSTTRSAGNPYPNADVTHTYLYEEQWVTIELTTTWRGSYSLDGGRSWRSAPGSARTSSTPITVYVYNPHSHRVNCSTDEECVT